MKTHYQQLTQVQRYQIEAGLACGNSQASIAKQVGVHPSTISREVKRNRSNGCYKATYAQDKSMIRRTESHKYSKPTMWLRQRLPAWLGDGMSPEQISARLRFENARTVVSHEWIYRFLVKDKQAGGTLYKLLSRVSKTYRKRYGSHDRRGSISNRVPISERPEAANERERLGDWEGDTVHGKGGNLVTLVDRKSRYLCAYPVKRRTRRQVTRAINVLLKPHATHTLTLDNGKEFSGHEHIAKKSRCNVYFADPYSSWQRGTNENTNGLLRRFFPKGSDFSKLTTRQVYQAVAKINLRPRKCLGWKSAYEEHTGVSIALMC